MEFSWTSEQLALKKRVKEFAADNLNDDVIARDEAGVFPLDAWKRCAEFGILSMSVPAPYNSSGVETDLMSAALAMEGLGEGCRDNGLAFAISAQMWTVQYPIVQFGTEEQKRQFLPLMCAGEMIGAYALTEVNAGSDHLSLETTAVPTEGGYLISGSKRFVSLGPVANVALVFATVDTSKGKWGVTPFLVPLDDMKSVTRFPRQKMGLRSAPFGDLVFDECFVPEVNRLGSEGAGASVSSASLAVERCFLLASQLGVMERQLNDSIEFAKTREQFGQPIGKFQSVSNRLADMRLALETARLLLYKTVWMLDNGQPIALESAMLKLHLSESFLTSSIDAIRIRGGAGYLTETEIERDARDAVGGILYSGTSDIQRVIISRLLGL